MNKRTFKLTALLIGLTILIVLSVQIYWNLKNYQVLRQRFINEVQVALDNGVQTYYARLAQNSVITINTNVGAASEKLLAFDRDSLTHKFEFHTAPIPGDSLMLRDVHVKKLKGRSISSFSFHAVDSIPLSKDRIRTEDSLFFPEALFPDSASVFKDLTSQVVIALQTDSLDINRLSDITAEELSRKKLDIGFHLFFMDRDRYQRQIAPTDNQLLSTSSFLPFDKVLVLSYTDATGEILRRGIWGILVSLLVTLVIIGSLVFLYRVIKHQKELAEIKNDLINNITHEFKTPIATVISALEGIKFFNKEQDPVKTEKYLDLSHEQLVKLNTMVEKILETAALDSDRLSLSKEKVRIAEVLHGVVEKYRLLAPQKTFHLQLEDDQLTQWVDPFHFENAISNLLDNAVKYGGDTIWLSCRYEQDHHMISIKDNGGHIAKAHRERIFDRFYRIPTGNIHQHKGFGIGLYYTRKIIEKHGGMIKLIASPSQTEFKIVL